ncbi:AI-2E family transporter [Romboutsia sp.]|uniref:AI-2E family transporter n=1 Tax=Romboutsia sp. TaxID=1965302 RepID=UPI003F2AF832
MVSRQNIKYFIFIAFISILIYRIVAYPSQFFSNISGLITFLSPFLLAIFFTLLLDPLVMIFEKKLGLHRLINIFMSYLLVMLLLLVCCKLLIPAIVDTLNILVVEIPNYINLSIDFFNKFINESSTLESIIPDIQYNINEILTNLINVFTKTPSDVLVYVLSITNLVFDIIIGIILSIYILFDKEKIKLNFQNLLYAFLDKNRANSFIDFFKMVHNIFYHYLIGQIIDALIVGMISFVAFKFIIKIDNVLFLSFIIFLTNMVPYFGPFIGAIPPILMTLVYSPIKALWIAIFIFLLQQLDGNFICPKIMSNQVGLGPIWVISAIIIGGSLFGFIGIFLSVPTAAVIKVYLNRYVENGLKIKKSR